MQIGQETRVREPGQLPFPQAGELGDAGAAAGRAIGDEVTLVALSLKQ